MPEHIYVSSLVRGRPYGFLRKLRPNSLRVVRKIRVFSDNDIAKHGGPHGLARLGDTIVTGTYSDIRIYDTELRLIRSFSHPYLSGVHGINTDEQAGVIWVSSCNNDAILCFTAGGALVDCKFLDEDRALGRHFQNPAKTISRKTDFRRIRIDYAHQTYHVNHVMPSRDGVLVCLHKQGTLWNVTKQEPVRSELGSMVHDAQLDGGTIFVNDTGGHRLVVVDTRTGSARRIEVRPRLPLRCRVAARLAALGESAGRWRRGRARSAGGAVAVMPHWLRGFARLDGDRVLVGTSPAGLVECDLANHRVVRTTYLSANLAEAVFAILKA